MAWYLFNYQGLDLRAAYYFDQGEPFEPVFKAKWERETQRDKETGGYSIWSHIEEVGSRCMRKTPGLQVADMLAWASNRERTMPMQRFSYLAPAMKLVMPSKWIIWDETNLRKKFRPLIYDPSREYER